MKKPHNQRGADKIGSQLRLGGKKTKIAGTPAGP